MQLFSAVGLFILPILIYSYLTGFDLNFRNVRRQNILLVFAIMLLIPPFISLLLEWNMQIQVPNFFRYFDRDRYTCLVLQCPCKPDKTVFCTA